MLLQSLMGLAPVSDIENNLMLILSNEAKRVSRASTCLDATSPVDAAAVPPPSHEAAEDRAEDIRSQDMQ